MGECAALRLCYRVLHAFAAVPGPKLQLLRITQHLDHATCLSAASAISSPLIVEDLAVRRVRRAVDKLRPRRGKLPALQLVKIEFGMEAKDASGLRWYDVQVRDYEHLCECDKPAAYMNLPFMTGSIEVGVSLNNGSGGRSSAASLHRADRCVRPSWAPQQLTWNHL